MKKKTLNCLELGDLFRFPNSPYQVYRIVGFYWVKDVRMCRYIPIKQYSLEIEASTEVII